MSLIIERDEAIKAGRKALKSLKAARQSLGKARGWGVYDIIGGGMLSSVIKHSHMNNARTEMALAGRDLEAFADELKDLNLQDKGLKFTNLFSLMDVFYDDIVADLVVQHRIKSSANEIDKAIISVSRIIRELENL